MRLLMLAVLLVFPVSAVAGGSFRPGAFSTPEEPTAAQIAACTEDAFRLCGEFMPDRQAVKFCMVRKRRYISQMCRESLR